MVSMHLSSNIISIHNLILYLNDRHLKCLPKSDLRLFKCKLGNVINYHIFIISNAPNKSEVFSISISNSNQFVIFTQSDGIQIGHWLVLLLGCFRLIHRKL